MSARHPTPLHELWSIPVTLLLMLASFDLASSFLLLYALPPSSIVILGSVAWILRAIIFTVTAYRIWQGEALGYVYALLVGIGLWLVQASELQHWLGASKLRSIIGLYLSSWSALTLSLSFVLMVWRGSRWIWRRPPSE